jgi:hypothetical protein
LNVQQIFDFAWNDRLRLVTVGSLLVKLR